MRTWNEPPPLAPGAVHLWLARDGEIRDAAEVQAGTQVLSEAERARAARYRCPDQAHQSRLAHGLKRHVLSLYRPEVAPDRWRFDAGSHGKPRLAGSGVPLAFNLSHARGLIALAVARSETLAAPDLLGVDVEATGRRTSLDIAKRFFAPGEVRDLAALPVGLHRARFFALWTLKESYIKARGLGLAIPLDGFAFSFPGTDGIGFRPDADAAVPAGSWRFAQATVGSGHALAVGCAAPVPPRLAVFEAVPGVRFRPLDLAWSRRSHGA
ncbi:4'-phosphopantetheinyl transferase superfamily protein [Stappia sp.]|uniref:4'-phosphopantetheinyl transferase family protein n=1 Tax=Stappia sp. TaxID=1870903 RepID=UPI0032D91B03